MADINRAQGVQIPTTMVSKYKDMGDDTHALVVSSQADLRVSDADVSTSNPLPVTVTEIGTVTVTEVDTVTLTSTNVRITASELLIDTNANRKYLLIENDSNVVIYIRFGIHAGINEGIRINANGGNAEFGTHFDNLDTRAVYGIAASGSDKNVLMTEGV